MKRMLAILLSFVLALPLVASSESATATLKEMYAQAELLMVQGDYAGAAAKFEALGAYSDASQMTMYCKAVAAAETLGLFSMAVDAFNDLGDFKDSKQMATYYQGRAYEAACIIDVTTASDSDLDKALRHFEEAEKIYGGLAFFKDSLTRMATCGAKIKEIKNEQSQRAIAEKEAIYQKALTLEQNGNFVEAINVYQTIRTYKDCTERIEVCQASINEPIYQEALTLELNGDYSEAIKLYQSIKGYKDCTERIGSCQDAIIEAEYLSIYQEALALEQKGDYIEAVTLYQSIKEYKDSAERAVENYYLYACDLMYQNKYVKAVVAFEAIADYKDARKFIADANSAIWDTRNSMYLEIPTTLMDENLRSSLVFLDLSYSWTDFTTKQAANSQGNRYYWDKGTFWGEECEVYIFYSDEGRLSGTGKAIDIQIILNKDYSIKQIKQKLDKIYNGNYVIYEETSLELGILIPNTDLRLSFNKFGMAYIDRNDDWMNAEDSQ